MTHGDRSHITGGRFFRYNNRTVPLLYEMCKVPNPEVLLHINLFSIHYIQTLL